MSEEKHEAIMPDIGEDLGWLLYDSSCGFCDRWIEFWQARLLRSGIHTAPLQSSWVGSVLGLSESDLMQDVMILLKDGTLVRGAEAYRLAMSRIWWAYPLYCVSRLPILNRVFDRCYRTFADNRQQISHACHMPRRGGR